MKRVSVFNGSFFVFFLLIIFMSNGCLLNSIFTNANLKNDSVDISAMQNELSKIGDTLLFDKFSYSIRPDEIQVLSGLGSWFEVHDCDFTIVGHTDGSGNRDYSFALGLRRAQSVFNYFLDRGIKSSRIKITSYGKESPVVVSSQDENSDAKNRRAVIVLKRCR